MYTILYLIFWSIIGVVLSKIGITMDMLEFWVIFLSILVLLVLRIKLYEKDVEENGRDKNGS